MGAIISLVQCLLLMVGFITVIVLAIGAWNGYIIRQVQELRRRMAQYSPDSGTYHDLKHQEDQMVSLIPVNSVKQALILNDSAIIDSVLHDHSVEVLGFTVVLVVGGRFEHEKVVKPDGSVGLRTVLQSEGAFGIFTGWLAKAAKSAKDLWNEIFR